MLYIIFLLSFLYSNVDVISNKNIYIVGEHIEVSFSGLDSNGSDWIGIFESGSSNEEYLYWLYTDGTQQNNYNFIESGTINFSPITLPTGEYEIRLFYNNNYELIFSYSFSISDSCMDINDYAFDDTFNVMTFNTWYSAQYGNGGLERVSEIIADLNIDVIGFQETDSLSIIEIKSFLNNFDGYEQLYSTPSQSNISIISRFPITDIYDYNLYGIGADITFSDIDTFKFVSSHLSAYPYGPYDLYEGVSIDEVIQNELSTRYLENLDIYNQIINNSSNNPQLPVIYVGDHNTPSKLDWGLNNINQNFGFSIEWPVSEFLLNNNFYDSYRLVNPSIFDDIGLTWSPGYPKNNFDSWDVHDRIDMIYFKHGLSNKLYPIDSYIYDCDPWPSDHRAVITEFAICKDSVFGDINLDNQINVLDIISLVNQILYSNNLYCLYLRCDIDLNSELNVLDVIQLVNFILD
tara:strand:+ start:482 stop:1867 length:1386 start_codon:yes stop_codon:yes gene_type:complete